jgi:UDP-2,3-diacylglucosamine hydrolase
MEMGTDGKMSPKRSFEAALRRPAYLDGSAVGRYSFAAPGTRFPAFGSETVVLFVSDMHFGRGAKAEERANEAALIECLEAHADQVDHLYLLGDVFDGYIEYKHLIPKGFVRVQGLIAAWTDRGIPITYLLGNHDPWHQDHFAEELGVDLVPDHLEVQHGPHRLHLTHGDAQASTHRGYDWVRPLLRHPWALRLYRTLLPADWGLALARTVSRALHEPEPDPAVVEALEAYAHRRLQAPGLDAVLMGHSHQSSLQQWGRGVYVNTGNWYENRTFARLEDGMLRLCRWNGSRTLDIESAAL